MRAPPGPTVGLFAGRYAIERVIGHGASATVHLARDVDRGIAVAIKMLRPELAQSGAAQRFLKEIHRTAALQHPNILPVLDSGEYEGQLYFVLPYMEGGTLRQLVKRETHLEFSRIVEISRTVAEALDYAHKRGLIHRDVKPENILFTNGQACLGDFGIARALDLSGSTDDSSTSKNTVRGTPAYMSPEQAAGGMDLDGRSDIYSLGCVIYEMITGMQAFIGPTPESVISQRFAFPPREVRVYRPTAPPAIDDVLSRAFAMIPADRFQTAGAFVSELDRALTPPPPPNRMERQTVRTRKRRVLITGGAATLILAIAAVGTWSLQAEAKNRALNAADTTRVLVLPVTGDTSLPLVQIQQILYDGISRWRGVTPIAADRRLAGGIRQERNAALAVAAGRYVRPIATRVGSDVRMTASLMDVRSATPLFEFAARIPASALLSDTVLHRVADSVLVRRLDLGEGRAQTFDLHALQLFANGLKALKTWNLEVADSLLGAAAMMDLAFGRAALWAGQVRLWRDADVDQWAVLAERAAADSSLSERESLLARALLGLARGDFTASCRHYDEIRRRGPRDFVAWYGLGDCRRKDNIVISDPGSPSGWRFRSSYNAALLAYVRAFELSPYFHRAFQPRGFNRLQQLLYTNGRSVRPGRTSGANAEDFSAYPEWRSDSLVFVPYRADVFASGQFLIDPQAVATAVVRQKRLFHRIAGAWSAALPNSASAKEVVAISLEMIRDSTALDTLRAARRLTDDDHYQLELAAEEVMIRFEFAANSEAAMGTLKALADSLLRRGPASVDQASILAPIAALRGRCSLAGKLRAPTMVVGSRSSQRVKAEALDLTIRVAMRCASPTYDRASAELIDQAFAERPGLSVEQRREEEYALLSMALPLVVPMDSARLRRHATTSDYLWRAQRALIVGDTAQVRGILERIARRRGPMRASFVSPDALLAESRLWIALGDTARARDWLDSVLDRSSWLDFLVDEPVSAASLMQCLALRTDISTPEESSVRSRWGFLVASLWADADPGPREISRQISARASRTR